MDEHIHIIISIIVICFIFLLTTLPQSHCSQLLPPPQQPPPNYSICREQSYSYSCGKLSNIDFYPFWGGKNRPAYCGGGDPFHLNCNNDLDTTTILIGSQNFTVMDIHPENHTMRMVRTDLADDVCSPIFNDTYLIPTLFRYPPGLGIVRFITIFYDCPSDVIRTYGYPICDNKVTFHPTRKDEALEAYPEFRRCGRHVQVPYTLRPGEEEVHDREALVPVIDEGFEVEYTVDHECVRCLGGARSGYGDCWNSNDDAHIEEHVQSSCYYSYCRDGSASTTQCSAPKMNVAGGWNWKTKLVIGAMSAVSATILLMCFIFCCFRCKPSKRVVKTWLTAKNDQDIEAFLKNHGALSQKRYKFSGVKKMTNSFKVKLGQGGFGAVYKGKLPNGCHVAVKILNASKGNGEDFINEVASISRTSHVNVVNLVGFCFEGRKKALIYEFMPNGSLDNFISNKGAETIASLSWENLYQIAKGIARGLEYLHRGCNTRILHFDIKPHNILLDENFCPKISDFGLAKVCPRKESIISMSDPRGTIGYIAPEVWNRQFGGVSHKSDVYSYGMMLLEMVGARKNINAEGSHTSEYFPDWVYNKLELGKDLKPDEVMTTEENEIIRRITIVGLWCIETFPSDRPTMSRVIDMLEGSMDSLEIPPKPKLSSPTRSLLESSTS